LPGGWIEVRLAIAHFRHGRHESPGQAEVQR
jgi:hypothetical protein